MTEKKNHRNDKIAYSTNVHCTVCDESRAKHKIAICKTIQLKLYCCESKMSIFQGISFV